MTTKLTALFLVGLMVVTAGCAGLGQTPTSDTGTTAVEASDTHSTEGQTVTDTSTESTLPAGAYPAGVGKSGVTNASRLIDEHVSVISTVSYSIRYMQRTEVEYDNGSSRWAEYSRLEMKSDIDEKRRTTRRLSYPVRTPDESAPTELVAFLNESGDSFRRRSQAGSSDVSYMRQEYQDFETAHAGSGIANLLTQIVEQGEGNFTLDETWTEDGTRYFQYTAPTANFTVRGDGLIVNAYAEMGNRFYLEITPGPVDVTKPDWVSEAKNETRSMRPGQGPTTVLYP
ncbi:hypothetical protein [Haloarchaeobius sp. HME9146]|uniref:hypothetical protein n=1 Tax=Haloarchaeobius sp. HME9146 TaxID=2978732 RepID=UPI0021C0C4C8|nr:hypothetical protein [Haloarchaeobius sp. HME9146]MCT9095192.1 hypothetical protein [Haloarchaeobius sp. HME9146]